MSIATPFIIAITVISLIWIFLELKRFRHKILAVLLIGLVISIYFSFTFVMKKEGTDLRTIPGIKNAVSIYFSWMGSIFQNFRTITSHVIRGDWKEAFNQTNSTGG